MLLTIVILSDDAMSFLSNCLAIANLPRVNQYRLYVRAAAAGKLTQAMRRLISQESTFKESRVTTAVRHRRQKKRKLCGRALPMGPWGRVVDSISSRLAFYPPTPSTYEVREHDDHSEELYINPTVSYVSLIVHALCHSLVTLMVGISIKWSIVMCSGRNIQLVRCPDVSSQHASLIAIRAASRDEL